MYSTDALDRCAKKYEYNVVQNLENGDERTAHAEAQNTSHVSHEPNNGDFLITPDHGHRRVFDVNVGQQQILSGVLM